ncbi:MAG: hypothetical protein CMI55_04310 [Parcubacteria group bacterium]|jgi:uncharacterized membrane protein|nr:hypothetical protein [Parcubacteria group bacterium]|tara:strand:+ start:494 stop:1186 length:693 start_codon:yes stop_codon:yes gene_type:complete
MIDQKIINRIQTSLSQGETKEAIYRTLLSEGQSLENIQQAFVLATREDKKEEAQKRVIKIIVVIGAILIGAGIFSFVAANWQVMDKWLKVVIIVASMIVSYSAGWYLKEKRGLIKTGTALILLGAIIYGAGIFLVAQIFHIRANWPDGFILWMIGVILITFAIDEFSLFALAIPLGLIAIIAHPFDIFTSSIANSFLLTSSFLLLAATIITFISGALIYKRIPEKFKDLY